MILPGPAVMKNLIEAYWDCSSFAEREPMVGP